MVRRMSRAQILKQASKLEKGDLVELTVFEGVHLNCATSSIPCCLERDATSRRQGNSYTGYVSNSSEQATLLISHGWNKKLNSPTSEGGIYFSYGSIHSLRFPDYP